MIRFSFHGLSCRRLSVFLAMMFTTYRMLASINYLEEDQENSSFRSKNLLTNHAAAEISDVQGQRRDQLHKHCRTFVDDYENLKIALLTDLNQTFAYCHVPKVASSAWMMFFAEINSYNNNSSPENALGEKNEYMNLHSSVMQKYSFHIKTKTDLAKRPLFKFVFLRHPFERLVSAYFDKFVQDPDPFFVRSVAVGEPYDMDHIRNTFNKLKKEHELKEKVVETISFKRFVKFVLHELKTGKISHGTYHWMPYSNFCGLCKVDYDFVGKMETLRDDLEALKDHIPAEFREAIDRIFNSRKNASKGKSSSTSIHYFSQISKNLILRLYRSYKEDFDLGGYPYPEQYIEAGSND